MSHMTVGNEDYGSLGGRPALHSQQPHDLCRRGVGTSGYYRSIKAASPNTLVGVVVDADNTTGGWDNTVLANAKGSYDFVEYHYYPEAPGQENDTTLVQQDAQQLTTNINTIKSELTKWGTPNTPIYVGEIGSVYTNPGKQSMSITQALYAGQVLGEMMNDGVSRADLVDWLRRLRRSLPGLAQTSPVRSMAGRISAATWSSPTGFLSTTARVRLWRQESCCPRRAPFSSSATSPSTARAC